MRPGKNIIQIGSSAAPKPQWQRATKADFAGREDLVHIWRIQWNKLNPEKYLAFLSPSEHAKSKSYHQLIDRQRFTISRGILRELSARYLKTTYKSLNCVQNRYGKPYFSNHHNHLQFNISHSAGIILIAFGFTPTALGIDLEQVQAAFDYSDIVQQYFSEPEIRSLECEDPAKQFFKLWTRKEAFSKAKGKGLTDESLALDLSPMDDYFGRKYRLHTFEMDAGFVFSLAGANVLENIRCFYYPPSMD